MTSYLGDKDFTNLNIAKIDFNALTFEKCYFMDFRCFLASIKYQRHKGSIGNVGGRILTTEVTEGKYTEAHGAYTFYGYTVILMETLF